MKKKKKKKKKGKGKGKGKGKKVAHKYSIFIRPSKNHGL
jgi:hypothetical protein